MEWESNSTISIFEPKHEKSSDKHFANFEDTDQSGRRGGLVVEHQTLEREVGGSILTRVVVLYS